jgi:uncharacterized Zn finger protein
MKAVGAGSSRKAGKKPKRRLSPDPDVDVESVDLDAGDESPPHRWWERIEGSKPIPVEGGMSARTRRGDIGSSWWSRRFLGALESVLVGGRMAAGRSYARKGQVVDMTLEPGRIVAQVQGTRATPYHVALHLPVVPDPDWDRIVANLGAQAGYAARLLSGDLPHEVEEVFAAEGASLFPGPGARLVTECSCPDWENPCKHIAAVCYLAAEGFDRDPFTLLAWRGRDRTAILGQLRRIRAAEARRTPPRSSRATGSARRRQAGEPAAPDGGSRPSHPARPLEDCLDDFWRAGPGLEQVRPRPAPADLPAAVLRHLALGVVEVGGRDIADVLAPAYAEIVTAATRRATRGG